MGEVDTSDAVDFDDSYSARHRALIHELVGRRMMPDRWRACERIYAAAGAPARFKTYEKLGHGTNGLVHAEVAAFLGHIAIHTRR